jgi:cytochrome c oxidase cbb3-type subunit III
MCLRFLVHSRRLSALAIAILVWSANAQAQQQQNSYLPASQSAPGFVAVSNLFPGGGSPPPEDPRVKLYQGNPFYINEGHRLFLWYNCVGCHANGGGGMGPALMDPQWRYGGKLDQIYASISQGRPNGMPSWAGKLPDGQIWELAAFVKSLSVVSSASGGPAQLKPVPPPPVPGQAPMKPLSGVPPSAPK